MKPELSVLICSYKNPQLLKLCIESIKKNVKTAQFEIVVADSETGEETRDLMREQFPEIKFLPNEKNVGFGSMVNQGLAELEGNYFFVINGDILVKDDAVERMLDFMKSNSNVGMLGPKLVNFDDSIQNSSFRFYTLFTILCRRTVLGSMNFSKKHLERFLMKKESEENEIVDADWIMGSTMMVKREAVEKVGLMDRRFFMYFEDVDWCWRFWQQGFRVVYWQKVKVFHYHGKHSASKNVINSVLFNRYARVHISSYLKFQLKHLFEPDPHKQFDLKNG